MLRYIIDGFNLAHRISNLCGSSDAQALLINHIKKNKLTGSLNNRVLVVFDGFQPLNFFEREFKVLFSGQSTADEIIKNKVSEAKNKKQVVVVSDDREIRDFAKQQGVLIKRTGDFLKTKKPKIRVKRENISYSLKKEITDELRRIWLKDTDEH